MTYSLVFTERARKDWDRLDKAIREQIKTVLARRLEEPRVPSARLHGKPERYKIKAKAAGYRLVYELRDKELVLLVIAVGRRDSIYDAI